MRLSLFTVILIIILSSCRKPDELSFSGTIENDFIEIKSSGTSLLIDNDLNYQINFKDGDFNYLLTQNKSVSPSVFLMESDGRKILFKRIDAQTLSVSDTVGNGEIIKIKAISTDGKIEGNISFRYSTKLPDIITVNATFINISDGPYSCAAYIINHLELTGNNKKWWTFQGASYHWGNDFVFPLPEVYSRENYMGLNELTNGGGIPLTNVWNDSYGIALAYTGDKPRGICLPVISDTSGIIMEIKESIKNGIILPGDSLIAAQTVIIAHKNDFFEPLNRYSDLMKITLPAFIEPPDLAYQPEWCTWGYRQNFTKGDILGKLEKLKTLGIKSVIFDDGWSPNHGDWIPDLSKFPGGDADFTAVVDEIHSQGLKAWLWWVPGYVDSFSVVAAEHRDWLIKNEDGSIHGSYGFCPAYKPVLDHYAALSTKFIAEYGIDGFKLDFGIINSAAPCYDTSHHHSDPFESFYSTPDLFETIYKTSVKLKPGILLEYCSCSIPPTIFHLPWANLYVTSDPNTSQITERIKMYKAIRGNNSPVLEEYCGVLAGPTYEYTIGTGGVPGTFSTIIDEYHEKWLAVYNKYQLSKGHYLNLYDIAFDMPESHVIEKDGKFYYAFYTHPWKTMKRRSYRFGTEHDNTLNKPVENEFPVDNFSGIVELRGLDPNTEYRITDYAHNQDFGTLKGKEATLNVTFDNYLLLELSPI